MANTTLSKDEILDAIGNMSVFDLADLIEAHQLDALETDALFNELERRGIEVVDEAPEKEEDDRAKSGERNRPKIKLAGGDGTPAELRSNKSAEERAYDAEENRDDATRGVPPWHQKLGQRSRNKTKKNPVEPERHVSNPSSP